MADDVTYQPSPDDVEAAYRAFIVRDHRTDDTSWKDAVRAVIAALHARGWRDAREVAQIRNTLSIAEAGRDAARAEVEAMRARFDEAARIAESIAVQRDSALSREHALVCDLESTIAEWKEMGEENITAETAAGVLAADLARSSDVSRNDALHYLAALRRLSADRDALAERCRAAEDAASEARSRLGWERQRADDFIALVQLHQARAAKLEAALRKLHALPEGPRAGCVPQYTVRCICAVALRADTSTAYTDGGKT